MIYISNAFSPNMIEDKADLTIERITKHDFITASKIGMSIIGHPEIAEYFKVEYNRIGITLNAGDVLYIVTPTKRAEDERYIFIPEDAGWTYRKITVH